MKADVSAQRRLLAIAELDRQLAQANHRKASLPEHAKLRELNGQRVKLVEDVVEAETRVSDATMALERAEADLEPARARLERNQHTIDGGTLPHKSLQAMIEETEHLRGRISTLEDIQLDLMEKVEQLTANYQEVNARKKDVETTMRELLASRDAATAAIDEELAELADTKKRQAAELPEDLRTLYDKIAAKSVMGAGVLRGNRCGGCALELDATFLKQVAQAPADQVMRCEECGRILVRE